MNEINKKPTFLPETKFLSLIAKSKEKFVKEFKKYNEDTAQNVYHQLLEELVKSVSNGNFNYFKNLSNTIEYISSVTQQDILIEYYTNTDNSIKQTNIVLLTCQHDKLEILEYLFNTDNKILLNLSVDVGLSILPNNKDYNNHNAFYYAILSGNINLLNTLITKWPGDYFTSNPEQLDEVLAEAYEELIFKNIQLSDKMIIFIEEKLINARFYSNAQNTKTVVSKIIERIRLLLDNIKLLSTEYNTKKVDDRFLFITKFIAQNIHILKRQLKSTYDRLPWEEIEFCLISFISSKIKENELNLFYQATLNQTKILNYLQYFAEQLESQLPNIQKMSVKVISKLPNFYRSTVVQDIIRNNPTFEQLYKDYKKIIDVYSLHKISEHIELALSADPNGMQGHFIITRVLQVIGEYLKNTLESPKLSNATSELLLLSLPRNTRKVIIDLRNSISHADSLLRRTEIEENTNVQYFVGIQNDLKTINDVINDILSNMKTDTCRMLLNGIINSKNLQELEEMIEILNNVDVFVLMPKDSPPTKYEKFDKLLTKLISCVPDAANKDLKMLKEIQASIQTMKTENVKTFDKFLGLNALLGLSSKLKELNINNDIIRGIKYSAKESLKHIPNTDSDSKSLDKFINTIGKLLPSIILGLKEDDENNMDEINRIMMEIVYMGDTEVNMKWIDGLRDKLHDKRTNTIKEIAVEEQLSHKISELKSILNDNSLTTLNNIMEKYTAYKKNNKLQATIEMLVLDIMSILDNFLENNLLFLEAPSPLLIGKCLRNHLAHFNTLVDLLLVEPSAAILLNAKKLTEENIIKNNKKKIGLQVKDDPVKLKKKYEKDLHVITNQQKMFEALEEGNLESVKECIKNGADLNSKSFNSWTSLHFASKGPSLEVVKFVLEHIPYIESDNNPNSNISNPWINSAIKETGELVTLEKPLHVAAINGRKNTVDYFIKKLKLHVDDVSVGGKTALHYAAMNGHKDTVDILLKHNANVVVKDMKGLPPLHYAVNNNYIDIVKVLLEKDINVDINETLGGYTSLHAAAERGYVKLVEFLLENNANVNAKTDQEWIPLHSASFNGHIETVNVLIKNGADINACQLNGCGALHYATENGHEQVVDVLLKHNAIVNVYDKSYKNSPLHYASKDGHEGIVQTLLKHKANVHAVTHEGLTPLHLASQSGHPGIVVALLHYGANVYAKDIQNGTPLHIAAMEGHVRIIEILITNNANVNAVAIMGMTPLLIAAQHGQAHAIEILIKHGGDVLTPDFKGATPLHFAASAGSTDVIKLLLKQQVNINAKCLQQFTPLFCAVLSGSIQAVQILLQHNAIVNNFDTIEKSALFIAVKEGYTNIVNLLIENNARIDNSLLYGAILGNHKEIVNSLIKHGVSVNSNSGNFSPLACAVKFNHKEIVELLIANEANVNNELLSMATLHGYADILKILLNKVNGGFNELICFAAVKGHPKILKELIKKGGDVNYRDKYNSTPLHYAVYGHEDVVELLILNGAKVNVANDAGETPLHLAVGSGHHNIVKMLLANKADANLRDKKNRIPFEFAVSKSHLQIVKTLLQYNKHNLNAQDHNVGTVLHIGACEGNLDIVKYLVEAGCDINAKNIRGSKPIHIAAREGFKDVVDYFLNKGLTINEPGVCNQTLIHYAAANGKFDFINYLIQLKADLNVKDAKGVTALHQASNAGFINVIEILLKNGAVYNPINIIGLRPADISEHENINKLFSTIDKLFKSVKRNDIAEVKKCIKSGVEVNVKNVENGVPLHYAACKGYDDIVQVLLENKANPNAIGDKGYTPLHYATKFSHFNVVKILLSNGAIYNALSDTDKTPMDFTEDTNIIDLLKFISEAFKSVRKNNTKIIIDINKIKDIARVRAIMNARNRESKKLVVAAMHNNFTKIDQLKYILQGDVNAKINEAFAFSEKNDSPNALKILEGLLEKSKEILGDDNPGTIDIQVCISKVYYKQGNYMKAMKLSEEIYEKQKEMLGINNEDTLSTRGGIALILHRQGRDEEALTIFEEVYAKEKEILGPKHENILITQLHMALTLDKLKRYDEALELNRNVYQCSKEMFGPYNANTIRAQNNIAMVLGSQGKTDEAVKIYKQVYEKKKIFMGPNHADTLRTLYNMALYLQVAKKYHESLNTLEELLEIQKKYLSPIHPDTLNTQCSIGSVFFEQGKWTKALKVYKECLQQRIAIFGPNNPINLQIQQHIKFINFNLQLKGSDETKTLKHLQKDINIAANDGDMKTIQQLIKSGADLNVQDTDGRTPLHFAVNNRHIELIKLLLARNADPTKVTNKGNTILHTAATNAYEDVVNIVLKHAKEKGVCEKFNCFIDAKTIKGGTTALHVASKNGFLNIAKILMEFGATYNSTNNNNNQTPLNVSTEPKIIKLLTLTNTLFEYARNGNIQLIAMLENMKRDDFVAVTNTRNIQGNTLLQVVILKRHKDIVEKLLKILKK